MLDRAREAMQDSAEAAGSPMFGDHGQAVFPGVFAFVGRATVDDDRQLGRAGQFHLLAKDLLLNIAWRVVVKIIEADFAPRNHLGMPRPLFQAGVSGVVGEARLMRMNADARPDFGIVFLACVMFREANSAIGGVGALAITDCQVRFDAVRFRASEYFVAI